MVVLRYTGESVYLQPALECDVSSAVCVCESVVGVVFDAGCAFDEFGGAGMGVCRGRDGEEGVLVVHCFDTVFDGCVVGLDFYGAGGGACLANGMGVSASKWGLNRQ